MTNTEIKIRLEKILVRNEQRKANKLIPSDVLDIKYIIKQLSMSDVSKQRELLIGFREWMRLKHEDERPSNDIIDEYLKTN